MIPESLTMVGRVVESSTIENDSFVRDSSVTLGFDIGKFLNHYQVENLLSIKLYLLLRLKPYYIQYSLMIPKPKKVIIKQGDFISF